MSDNSNLTVGAVIGGAAGTSTGFLAGIKQANKILNQHGILKTGRKGSDEFVKNQLEYVKGRLKANEANVSSLKQSNQIKTLVKIGTKAKEDFVSVIKKANFEKAKYAATAGLICAAIGVGINALLNNEKTEKSQKA